MSLNKEYDLKIFKCRDVKSPSKAWDAAGFDFFIPENLTIWDFTKNSDYFLNDSIIHDKSIPYQIPIIFYLKSNRTVGEFEIELVLTWNEVLKTYSFNICEKSDESYKLISFDEVDSKIMQWITEPTTIISKIKLLPSSKILIPSGIHVNLPKNIFLKAENKSGIAAKRGLIVGSSVVDVDYQGEIHISLINTSNNDVIIKAGEKIVQFVRYFQPNMNNVIEYSSKDELYKDSNSMRGDGGFGSSGIK